MSIIKNILIIGINMLELLYNNSQEIAQLIPYILELFCVLLKVTNFVLLVINFNLLVWESGKFEWLSLPLKKLS